MDYSPSLFLGLGGTGYLVLSKLKRKLEEIFESDDGVPNSLQFLVVDIDTDKPQDLQKNDPAFKPTGNEFWCPTLPPLESLDKRIAEGRHPYLKKWFPENLNKVFQMTDRDRVEEAYQHRCVGRAALFIHGDSFYQKIHSKITHVMTGVDGNAVDDDTFSNRPKIYMVCSLAGGTGSGMFLDAGAILRTVAPNIELIGIFFLPNMFVGTLLDSGHDSEIPFANTYGALKELDYFQIDIEGHEFNVEYTNKLKINGLRKIFDMVYLIDTQREKGAIHVGDLKSRNHVAEAVSDYVLTNISAENWGGGGGLAPHIGGFHNLGDKNVSKCYSSFGAATLEYPLDIVLDFTESRLSNLLCDGLRSGEQSIELITRIIDGDEQGGESLLWNPNGSGPLMPKLDVNTDFGVIDSEAFKSFSKKDLAKKIELIYRQKIASLKIVYNKLLILVNEWPSKDSITALDSKVKKLIRSRENGLPATLELFSELLQRISQCKKDHLPNADVDGNFEKIFMKTDELRKLVRDYNGSFQTLLWNKRKPHVANMMLRLAGDLNIGIKTIKDQLINTACDKLSDYIMDEEAKIENIVNMLQSLSTKKRAETSRIDETINNCRGHKIFVGVEDNVFTQGGYIDQKLHSMNVVNNKESVLRASLADNLDLTEDEIMKRSQEGVVDTNLSQENIFDKLGTGDSLKNRLINFQNAAIPMWPLDTIEFSDSIANKQKRILANYNESEVSNRGGALPDGTQWNSTHITGRNKFLSLVLNPGKPFEYLEISSKCYETYLKRDVNASRAKKWRTTVLPEAAKFPELVFGGLTGMSVEKLYKSALKLGLVDKTPSGRCNIIIQIEPDIKKRSFTNMKRAKEELNKNAEFAQNVRKMIIVKLVELGKDGAEEWLHKNQFIIPRSINIDVRNRLQIPLPQI